jgi:hypothetical protein
MTRTVNVSFRRVTKNAICVLPGPVCLGAALARAGVSEALTALSARFGPPELAGPVGWRPPIGIFGPERLPLRFAPPAES